MITIVNYGLGNVSAIANIYKRLSFDYTVATKPSDLQNASRLILPGVGAFDWAISRLESSGMRPFLDDLVLLRGIPVLGICVGMQMMSTSSEEGQSLGLGWIPGQVKKLNPVLSSTKTSLPHMGWNSIAPKEHPIFDNIHNPEFYFLHSYYYAPRNNRHVLAESDYGQRFASAVFNGNIIGVQFHPEKSHHSGVGLLQNFASL